MGQKARRDGSSSVDGMFFQMDNKPPCMWTSGLNDNMEVLQWHLEPGASDWSFYKY